MDHTSSVRIILAGLAECQQYWDFKVRFNLVSSFAHQAVNSLARVRVIERWHSWYVAGFFFCLVVRVWLRQLSVFVCSCLCVNVSYVVFKFCLRFNCKYYGRCIASYYFMNSNLTRFPFQLIHIIFINSHLFSISNNYRFFLLFLAQFLTLRIMYGGCNSRTTRTVIYLINRIIVILSFRIHKR